MKDIQIKMDDIEDEIQRMEMAGKTVMLIAIEKQYVGWIAVADTVKKSAKESMQKLKQRGLQLVMLTGDNERTAHAIAKEDEITR